VQQEPKEHYIEEIHPANKGRQTRSPNIRTLAEWKRREMNDAETI
jgi:hypothetical protein